jgi:hypothetical protein
MAVAVTNPFAVIDEVATKSAAVGELFASFYKDGSVAATGSWPVFVAPFALQVKQVSVVHWNGVIAADDTNYWRFTPRRWRAGSSVEIASKTTQLTGGQAIANRTDWNFDAASFNSANSQFAKGDVSDIAVFVTGAPATLVGFAVTIRYEPL